ncbi:MAG TPA: glycosyltransferase family 2 protein [Azospirillaceae bacterium]|nr:glycosyltransferase family 2 protein [Azospirillaceae bacterium]
MPRPRICLTLVRNEAWILPAFLQAASTWADHILICDHRSDDGSREIAAGFPKVRVIDYADPAFDGSAMRALLLAEARRIAPGAACFPLDADEILSAGHFGSDFWTAIDRAEPGTVFDALWRNLAPGLEAYVAARDERQVVCWIDRPDLAYGDRRFNEERAPRQDRLPRVHLDDICLMHLQYADWPRFSTKICWYQCVRKVAGEGTADRLAWGYRAILNEVTDPAARRPLPPEWLDGYRGRGIDLHIRPTPLAELWRVREVLDLMARHGTAAFKGLLIWDHDWVGTARELGVPDPDRFADPRDAATRWVHRRIFERARGKRKGLPRHAGRVAATVLGW